MPIRRSGRAHQPSRSYKSPSSGSTGSCGEAGVRILIEYGRFTWDEGEFHITQKDTTRFKSFFNTCVQEHRLTRGYVKSRAWIKFVTLSRIARSFLEHNLHHEPRSWDVVVGKLLSVTLVSALGCRGGDVTLSNGYTGEEFLRYSHIQLYVGPTGDFHSLKATVTLEYTKGCKYSMNDKCHGAPGALNMQDRYGRRFPVR